MQVIPVSKFTPIQCWPIGLLLGVMRAASATEVVVIVAMVVVVVIIVMQVFFEKRIDSEWLV